MFPITKQLLVSYFTGQLKGEEKKAAEAFIAGDTDPQLVQLCIREVFDTQESEHRIVLTEQDYEQVWLEFTRRSGWQDKPSVASVKQLRPFRWLRYTAAAILIAAVSIVGMQTYLSYSKTDQSAAVIAKAEPQQIRAEKGSRKQIKLADGSVVFLFPGSCISIPTSFNTNDRKIQLKGRAFFEITKNPEKPFIVQTATLATKVLGTSFEVNEADSQVHVAVGTGLVGIHNAGNAELTKLSPGQQINYQNTGGTFTVNNIDVAQISSWINGELVFDNTPLPEVCKALEQWYGAEIQLDRQLWKHKKISVKFSHEPLFAVMEVLSLTSGFKYRIQNRNISIYSKK